MPVLYIRGEDRKFVPIRTEQAKDGKTAYEFAVEGGYQGTEEEFITLLNGLTAFENAGHYINYDNPHKVTAKQIGAIPEVYYLSKDLDVELSQGGNRMTVCYYNSGTLNSPHSQELTDYAHGMVITNSHTSQYGTQLCLPSGDDSMYLRSLNKLGITEWNKISYKDIDKRLENTVKKTGDTITGAMTVKKSSDWGQFVIETPEGYYRSCEADDIRMRLDVRDTTETENRRFLDIYSNSGESDLSNALRIAQVNDGKVTTATLLHTKNKPSGTYIGNDEAREIAIGGIGNALLVYGIYSNGNNTRRDVSIITPIGAIASVSDGGSSFIVHSGMKFENGKLSLDDISWANEYGVTYSFQVL